MVYCYFLTSASALSQASLNFVIPLWVWILLGVLLLAVILGLILGEKMAEEPDQNPTANNTRPAIGLIPQTGGLDLTMLDGIDQETQAALNRAGITNFEQLAQTSIQELRGIIRPSAGQASALNTWPDQARLAAAGQWDELREWLNRDSQRE